MGKLGTVDLLLHILQCWRTCAVNEENQDMPLVMYCSQMMYKYYSLLRFYQIEQMR